MKKHSVEFVSYDGSYPNLCSGSLVIKLDGIEFVFPPYCLLSNGGKTDDYEDTYEGKWEITRWPDNFPETAKAIVITLVNDNVPLGCCGGCI